MNVKTFPLTCLIILVAAIALIVGKLTGAEPPGSRTEFLSLFESREWHDESEYRPGRHTCHVFARLHHSALVDPAGYANVSVEQAVDDTGTSMVDLHSGLARGLMENTRIHLLSPLEVTAGADPSIIVQLQLLPGDRQATKIVRLRGHLQVRVGGDSVTTIRIPKLGKLDLYGGTDVTDPALPKQRLKLRLGGYETSEGKGVVSCVLSDNIVAVRKIRIVDADGRILAEKQQDPNGQRLLQVECETYIEIPRPPDDRMTLEIDVVQNQKVVTLPFELHDVELP